MGLGSTAAIVSSIIIFGVLVYLFCFRKDVNRKQTQKLMDATNNTHPHQEPHGTISPGVLPDGSVGLLVRPHEHIKVLVEPTPVPVQAPSQLNVCPPNSQHPGYFYPPSSSQSAGIPPPNSNITSSTMTSSGEIMGIDQTTGQWEPRPFVPPETNPSERRNPQLIPEVRNPHEPIVS